jgi:hypothetical protein
VIAGFGVFWAAPPQKQKENERCDGFYKQVTPLGFEPQERQGSPPYDHSAFAIRRLTLWGLLALPASLTSWHSWHSKSIPAPSVLVRLDSLCPTDLATIIAKNYEWQNHPPPQIRSRPAQSARRRRPTQTSHFPLAAPGTSRYHPVSPNNSPEQLLRPQGVNLRPFWRRIDCRPALLTRSRETPLPSLASSSSCRRLASLYISEDGRLF